MKNIAVKERAAIDFIDFEPWLLKSAGWVKPCPSSLLPSPHCLHLGKLRFSETDAFKENPPFFHLTDNSWLFLSDFPLRSYCALAQEYLQIWKAVNYMLQFTFCHLNKESCSSWEPLCLASPVSWPCRALGRGKERPQSPAPAPGPLGCPADTTWALILHYLWKRHLSRTNSTPAAATEPLPLVGKQSGSQRCQRWISASEMDLRDLRDGSQPSLLLAGRLANPLGSSCLLSTRDKYNSQTGVFPVLLVCRGKLFPSYTSTTHMALNTPRWHFLCYSERWKFFPSSGCFSRCWKICMFSEFALKSD